jgi:hypothetical protein
LRFRVSIAGRVDDRVGQPVDEFLLAADPPRPQQVQADPRDDGRQPRVEVVDVAGVAAQPQRRLLHGVVGVVDRSQHPVGDRTQPRTCPLEASRQSGIAHTIPSEKPAAPMSSAG